MNSAPPPQVGFNNNVRYKGMRFHIQTEDSGVSRPHILTHLFADGGHVIKSLRTNYAEFIDHPDRTAMIQRMMRDQHRAMAIELRDGSLDATIDNLRRLTADPDDLPSETVKFAEPRAIEPSSTPPVVVAKRLSEPPKPAAEARRSRPPGAHTHRPSRPPEAGKKRRSVAPPPKGKGRRSLGRPSTILGGKPSADNIFGALPQESLDDVILSYVSHTKNTPDPRGRK